MGFVAVYRRVLGLLAPERGTVCILLLANLALAGLQFVEPLLFGRVVDVLGQAHTEPQRQVWQAAVSVLLMWGVVGVTGILANLAVSLLADRMAHRNRLAAMGRFFQHVLALPPAFHGETQSGRLMKVMLVGTDNLFTLWLSFFRDHLVSFIAALLLLPATLLLNWRLGLLLVALVALFAVLAAFVISRTQTAQEVVEGYNTRLAGTAQDTLSNVVVVQSFGRLAAEARGFRQTMQQVLEHQFPVLNWWALVAVLTRTASTLAVIAIFLLGTVLNLQGKASVGEIVTFMGFATLLIGRLEGAVAFIARLVFQRPALAQFFSILDTRSSLPLAPQPLEIGRARGDVAFHDVDFAYPQGPPVLRGVNFTCPAGRVVALVGQTGAGKSTAMSLLQRQWDPTGGSITLDGHDLRMLSVEALQRNIGVVFQEALLFNRTIRENLLVGRPDATQAELEQACLLAEARDFILRQPQGYDTLVGERGSSLSGGQRQRLAIARALLKDPPVLILDEATSALDAATEARVQKALGTLMQGRTTFIIAHRLSTVREADEILVFADGVVAEQGSFASLLQQGGIFADLVRTQMAGNLHEAE